MAGRRARSGRPIKLYRAIADAFFVPTEAAATSQGDVLAAELRASRARLADPSCDGTLYHLSEEGGLVMRPISNPRAGRIGVADSWRILQLSPIEALRLGEDLDACLKSAAERSRGSTKTYLAHFAFAPRLASTAVRGGKKT